jgi:hypothetical protein
MLPLVLLMSGRFHENTKNILNDGNSLPNDAAMPPRNMDLQYRELLNARKGVSSELYRVKCTNFKPAGNVIKCDCSHFSK